MYKLIIDGVTEINEGIIKSGFYSAIPPSSAARSTNLDVTMFITGKIIAKNPTQAIAEWSLEKQDTNKIYRKLILGFDSDGIRKSYEFSHAFVVSYAFN